MKNENVGRKIKFYSVNNPNMVAESKCYFSYDCWKRVTIRYLPWILLEEKVPALEGRGFFILNWGDETLGAVSGTVTNDGVFQFR